MKGNRRIGIGKKEERERILEREKWKREIWVLKKRKGEGEEMKKKTKIEEMR